MAEVVVTGAGGFIGGHLVRHLLAEGTSVRAVDCKPVADWYQAHSRAENVSADLRDLDACRRAVPAGCPEVYHLAADMGGMGFIENNKAACMLSVVPDTNMLIAARDAHAGRYFFASSACVYNGALQSGSAAVRLREEDAYPAMPEDGYGWEKLFGERMATHFREDFGLATRIARFHNVYGPEGTWSGGREKAPAALCRKVAEAAIGDRRQLEIWGNGEQRRSFLYITDCIDGIIRLTRSDEPRPTNIGSELDVSINELAGLLEEIAGVRLNRTYRIDAPLGVRSRSSDSRRAKEQLGWEERTPLAEGLKATYQWVYKQVLEAAA